MGRGGSRGRVQGVRPPLPEMTCRFLIQLVFCTKKKTKWCIGVEVEQETSAPPPIKNPGSATDGLVKESQQNADSVWSPFFFCFVFSLLRKKRKKKKKKEKTIVKEQKTPIYYGRIYMEVGDAGLVKSSS